MRIAKDRIPAKRDRFVWRDFAFEILAMDGQRVATLRIKRGRPEKDDEQHATSRSPSASTGS